MEDDLNSNGNVRTLRLDGRRIGVGMRRGWGRCRVGVASWGCWRRGADGVSLMEGRVAWLHECVGRVAQLEGGDWRLIEGFWWFARKGFCPRFGCAFCALKGGLRVGRLG